MGLKVRNGFGEKDLAGAVGTALRRRSTKRKCEDCGVTVARGAAYAGAQGGGGVGARGWTGVWSLGLAVPNPPPGHLGPRFRIESCATPLRDEGG
jgi:hypothetical protein